MWCHRSLPEPCLRGRQGLATVQRNFVRCWCAAAPAAVSRHNCLQAAKTSHPSAPAAGGPRTRACPMGSTGVGAHRAQPSAGCSRTNLPPSPFTYQTFPAAAPAPTVVPRAVGISLALGIPRAAGRREQLPSVILGFLFRQGSGFEQQQDRRCCETQRSWGSAVRFPFETAPGGLSPTPEPLGQLSRR